MAVSGTLAYTVASGSNTFSVVDLANPVDPAILGQRRDNTNLPTPYGVFASAGYVYVVGSSYISIMNVSNSASPTIAGRLSDGTNLSSAKEVYVSGNYAYVTKNNGLTVVDVTNKAAPTFVTQVSNAVLGNCTRIIRSGSYLYLSCNSSNSMAVISIATPNAPILVGSYQSATELRQPASLHKNGNYVYVATQDGISTIDVSVPATPSLVVNSRIGQVFQMIVNGNFFYLSYYDGSSASLGMGVLNANQAVVIGGITSMQYPTVHAMHRSGNYIYVVGSANSLQILDVSAKPIPLQINNPYNEESWLSSVKAVVVDGTTAYLTSGGSSRLTAVNVSDPVSPTMIATMYDGQISQGTSLAKAGNYVFVQTNSNGYTGAVIDVSNPTAMSKVATIYQSGSGKEGKISGDYHFWIKSGFSASNVLAATSISALPTVTTYSSHDFPNAAADFAISGNYAFACTSSTDLQVMNISNPASMTLVTSITNAGFANCGAIMVSGNYLFVAGTTSQTLTVVDITAPTAPAVIGSVTHMYFVNVRSMKMMGSYLHTVSSSGLATVDISTPTAPLVIDSSTGYTSGPEDLFVSGTRGYIADTNRGLVIFDYLTPTAMGACTKPGEVIYDSAQSTLKYCKDTTYYAMGPSPGAGGVGCVSPIAAPGQYQYFSAPKVYRYCDGTNWVQVGN